MNWIDAAFVWLSETSRTWLPEGPLNSLISDGIIPGIGGIVIFAPQIGIFYILYFIRRFWLHGESYFLDGQILTTVWFKRKSIVPHCFGNSLRHSCNYEYQKHRKRKRATHHDSHYAFMTCSARLPVYSIIIALIFTDGTFFVKYKAIALLLGMYFSRICDFAFSRIYFKIFH